MITLTDAAKAQIEMLCKNDDIYAVTLNMKGGGCAGFEYSWNTASSADEIDDNATIIDAGDGILAISPESLLYLIGSVIDYTVSIMGSQFEINNPMAASTCGCGISVNIDMNKVAEIDTSKIVEVK
jgi:iron-sulfur cluster insertion protein